MITYRSIFALVMAGPLAAQQPAAAPPAFKGVWEPVSFSEDLQSLPPFVERFKNTNLLAAGPRMTSTMPSELGALRGAVNEFKGAQHKDAAKSALERVVAAAATLKRSTKLAFQKPQ